MERLTVRLETGEALTRMDIRNNGHGRCLEKLAQYEDLEEQGKLLSVPPCRPGSDAYVIDKNSRTGELTNRPAFKNENILKQQAGYTLPPAVISY